MTREFVKGPSKTRGWLVASLLLSVASGCSDGDRRSDEAESAPTVAEPTRARHIPLTGQPNFRDLGGYRTADGRVVKWGEVYRSGELGQLTDADVSTLQKLHVGTVVSFLLPSEIEKHGDDRLPESTRLVRRPINSDRAAALTGDVQKSILAADFDSIPPALNAEFHRVLLDDGREQYAALLREVSDRANRPFVFHCSHGIHRTGTAAAILLSALGVPWDTIRADYLLSNEYRRGEIEKQLEKVKSIAADKRGIPMEEVDMSNAEAFFILDGSYIDGSLERAVETYGSIEGYIRNGLGITDEEIERLRDELLESPR